MRLVDLPAGEPERPFVVVDPGKRCGLMVWTPNEPWGSSTVDLDDLPHWLIGVLHLIRPAFVVCEDFSLTGGNQRNDPKMPASQGIGMCKAVCIIANTPLILVPRNVKTAGHKALDAAGTVAFATCKNDHTRDVVDIGGYTLRELRARKTNSERTL